jgi:surface antigen
MSFSSSDTVRYARAALATAGLAAIIATSACAPLATLTHAAAKTKPASTAASKQSHPAASGGSVMPTYTSPAQTRVALTHNVSLPALTAYPWAGDQTQDSDPYGMTKRQCVSYAAWYLNSHGTPFGHFTQGPRGVGTFGDASTWDAGAYAAGFTVSSVPVVGSIAQWHANERSTTITSSGSSTIIAGSQGHVAVVTRVYSDGAVDLAQYNFGFNRAYGTSSHVKAPRYIYVPLASPYVP